MLEELVFVVIKLHIIFQSPLDDGFKIFKQQCSIILVFDAFDDFGVIRENIYEWMADNFGEVINIKDKKHGA